MYVQMKATSVPSDTAAFSTMIWPFTSRDSDWMVKMKAIEIADGFLALVVRLDTMLLPKQGSCVQRS